MARFSTYTVGSQVLVLPKGLKFEYPEEPEVNYIDHLVAAKLKKLRIAPSGLCDDETYLRRVFLDIVGLPPTVEEYEQFMSSTDPDKRAKLIDELLGRKEFSEIWVNKWAEILQVKSSNQVSYKSMFLYYNWLVEKVAKNTPMDQMVQELLGASGGTFKNAATNYYQEVRQNLQLAENVAQVFMGMRIQCAQCHNHPFDRWTQNDYYGFAAFFAQIGRKQGEDYRETIVFNSGGGEVRHPVGEGRHEAQVPGRRRPRRQRQGPPRRAGRMARLAREPLVRHVVRQPGLGPLHGHRHRRAGRRLPGQQPGVEPRAARSAGAAVHRLEVRPQDPRPRHLQLADLPADDPAQREQHDRRAELRPRQPPPDQGREPARHDQRGDRHQGQVPGPPPRRAGRADRRRPAVDLLPDHLRPRHPRDRLLVRGQDGADPLPGPPPAQRRHHQRQDPARAT